MPGNQKPRQRKHRGTQTGSITRPQRTRPRNRQEAMAQARSRKGAAKGAPIDRRNLPPSWRSAIIRGVLFAALLFPISLLFNQPVGGALALSLIAAALYVPLGFYTQSFFYKREQAKARKARAEQQAESGRR